MCHKTFVWMEITQDKYGFPIYIADSPRELSRICHVRSDVIELVARNKRITSKYKRFIVVEIDDSDDL